MLNKKVLVRRINIVGFHVYGFLMRWDYKWQILKSLAVGKASGHWLTLFWQIKLGPLYGCWQRNWTSIFHPRRDKGLWQWSELLLVSATVLRGYLTLTKHHKIFPTFDSFTISIPFSYKRNVLEKYQIDF